MMHASATAGQGRRIAVPRRLPRPGGATLGLLGILVLAAAARAVWIVYATRQPAALHDPVVYLAAGDQLARGVGYHYVDLGPSAYFPPGFPLALGALFWLVRHTPIPEDLPRVAAAFNAAVGVASVALVYALGRRLLGVGAALTAAAIVALWPNLVFHGGAILSEPLFIFLVLSALTVVLWRPWPDGRVPNRRLVAFGLLVGLAALTRPVGGVLVLALAGATWIAGAGARRALTQGGIALVAAVVVIVPWTVRNAIVMDSPILISTNAGDDLCTGHNPEATGKFLLTVYCEPPPLSSRRAQELRHYRWNTKEAWTYATHHPGREAELLWLRTRYTFAVGDHDAVDVVESYGSDKFIERGLRSKLVTTADAWYYAVAALALLGLPGFLRGDPRRLMIVFSVLALAVAPLTFFGGDRFHVPMLPLWALVATVPLSWLAGRIAQRKRWQGREVPG
jgi:4-amino-4-deoxy-L-arabinose transferase-like glycosyltransferase